MKEVFVFGAGASKASAGTPLGKELGWEYFQRTTTFYEMDGGKPADYCVTEKKAKYSPLREFLCVAEKYYPERFDGEPEKLDKTIEDGAAYLSPFFMINEDHSIKKYFVDDLLKKIIQKGDIESQRVVKNVAFHHIIEAGLGKKNKLYGQFADVILRNKLKENATIISFNFDSLLCEYFKPHPETGIYFDYMIDFSCSHCASYKYVSGNCFPLIKLHGSLDWGICRKCNEINLNFYDAHAQNYKGCHKCKTGYEPFIFVPYEKIEDKRIRQLWDIAAEKLRLADKVTIIGYSFPEYDTRAINLFKENINSNACIEVVDYRKKDKRTDREESLIKERYMKMFEGKIKAENLKVRLDGFEGYMGCS